MGENNKFGYVEKGTFPVAEKRTFFIFTATVSDGYKTAGEEEDGEACIITHVSLYDIMSLVPVVALVHHSVIRSVCSPDVLVAQSCRECFV